MSGCVIRHARAEDISGLIALDSFAAPGNDRSAEIADWVGAGWCWCAEAGDTLAGYAVMHPHFFGQPMLELVMVGERFRRQGIGTTLIARAIEAAGPTLWTSTNQSNRPMQALLEQLGFQPSGMVEGLDEGDPELIYQRAAPNRFVSQSS